MARPQEAMAPRLCRPRRGPPHHPRRYLAVALPLLLLASLASLAPLSRGEDGGGASSEGAADSVFEEYDEELQATVYLSRRDLAGGAWRPQRSAAGFHISKFLGGVQLSEDMARAVSTGQLDAEDVRTRRPLRFVLNYAAHCCREAQEANCRTALRHSADVCIAFRRESLGKDFSDRNAETLNLKRGVGYWIWKPYLIFKVLMEVQEGDVVMYSEFASVFEQDLAHTFSLPEVTSQDVVFFGHPRGEEGGPRAWSKGDVLTLLDCYNNSCTEEAPHVTAAYSVWKKSEESVLLASHWMSYMEDPRVATDLGDSLGFPNLLYRTGEPQESAVAGIIAYKWGLKAAPKEALDGLVSLGSIHSLA